MNITKITAYEILASGGYPTIEVKVTLESGVTGIASVPFGASAGTHEATVLMDTQSKRYQGNGMLQAVENVTQKISPLLIGHDVFDQRGIDQIMITSDGTENKANLGGNAILAVSLAVAKAAANEKKVPLYVYIRDSFNTGVDFSQLPAPMMVMIEGGKHADKSTDFQEYSISAIGNESVSEKVRKTIECYHALKSILKEKGLSVNVGNEGAFAPNGLTSNEEPLAYLVQSIERAGHIPGVDLAISIDPATSEVYSDGKYHLSLENKELTSLEMIEYFKNWLEKYPFVTAEDLLSEDDWENWPAMTAMTLQKGVQHIGDDLTVTSSKRLQKAIDLSAISSILIKLNQIGTLTETVDCCMLAKSHGMSTVPSHRGGGETNDAAMVDLAVAVGSQFIKVGPTRGERVSKYNRLMEIERELEQQ